MLPRCLTPSLARGPAVRRDEPPRAEQLIVSSSAPRSEGSLGVLTYFCCCLKVHKSGVECEFGTLVMSRTWG